MPPRTLHPREANLLVSLLVAVFLGLGLDPKTDRLTWILENLPVLIVLPVLVRNWSRFPFTRLVSYLMAFHAVILMFGGHYSYAEVPLGDWFKEAFDLSRNHYDRLGHFAQGFVPALMAREVLLRKSILMAGPLTVLMITLMCLGFSAFYELIEWWAALLTSDGATAFLGTQGDVWDTQWDMFLCGVGALCSQICLGRWHDRQLA